MDHHFLSHRGLISFNRRTLTRMRSSRMHRGRCYIFTAGKFGQTAYKVIPMSSANPLELLRDLDRSSSEFPNQLTSILLREDCMNRAQALPCEDLGKFVEYLDSVCVQIVFTCSPLNGIVGPRRPRPQRLRLFSLFVRTPEGLRRSQCPTDLTRTLVCSYGLKRASGLLQRSGRYVQGDPRRLDSLR
jgi:hypothetical protein